MSYSSINLSIRKVALEDLDKGLELIWDVFIWGHSSNFIKT